MITHRLGQDTRIAFDWADDDGTAITPTAAAFDVIDADGEPVLSVALADPQLVTSADHALELHLGSEWGTPGLYSYVLRVEDGTDWTILSAGLLRVK